MNLLMYMGPVAVAILLPAALYMEEDVVGITIALARDDVSIVWYLVFNSALAYFVNLTNFLVTKHTSALTLQVKILSLFFAILNLFATNALSKTKLKCGTNASLFAYLMLPS